MRQPQRSPRRGFTLVELLVVILIILILIGLLLPAIMRVWGYVEDVRTSTEIRKLSEACENFKTHHHTYPPARILLRERMDYLPGIGGGVTNQAQMEQYSLSCLNTMFNGINNTPYLVPNPTPAQALAALQNGLWHDWNGNNFIDTNPMFLEGEESLVYWLSGMRYGPVTDRGPGRGFNSNVIAPTINTTGERKGPYFEFDARRLTNLLNTDGVNFPTLPAYAKNILPLGSIPGSGGMEIPPNSGNWMGWFPVYLDRFGSPYAYFRARGNSQNNYMHVGNPVINGTSDNPIWLTDCSRLTDINPGLGITLYPNPANPNRDYNFNLPDTIFVPYTQYQNTDPTNAINTTYMKVERFQIVSAGRDKLFGSGGAFNEADPENSGFNFITNPPVPNLANPDGVPLPPPYYAPPSRRTANSDNFTNFVGNKLIR